MRSCFTIFNIDSNGSISNIDENEWKSEDEWVNTNARQTDQADIIHFLYEYLPIIDEHTKQKKRDLVLEKGWLSKNVWFCLICTIVGMSVADMHRRYRFSAIEVDGRRQEEVDIIIIFKYRDLIWGNLRLWKYVF